MESYGKTPFLRILLPFITGTVVYFYFSEFLLFFLLLFLVVGLFMVIFNLIKNNHFNPFQARIWSIAAQILLMILGYVNAYLYEDINFAKLPSKNFEKEQLIVVRIAEVPVIKTKSVNFRSELIQIGDSTINRIGHVNLQITTQKSILAQSLALNDKIALRTKIREFQPPPNPYQFDHSKFQRLKNLKYTAFADSGSLMRLMKSNQTEDFFQVLRKRLKKVLQENIQDEEDRAVVSALVIGDKSELDADTRQKFSYSGTMHILAVSGLHVAAIYLLFEKLLFFLDKKRYLRILKILILLSALWFYALIADLSPSVLRASLMFSLVGIGKLFGSRTNIYNSIFASAFLIILFAPFELFEVGFMLSYCAVLGIVALQPFIYNWFDFKNKLLDKIWNLSSVTLAAQIATTPISLYFFGTFPNLFFLSNLLAVPLASLILYTGVLSIFTYGIPLLGNILGFMLSLLVHVLNFVADFFGSLPFAAITDIRLSFFELIGWYGLIFGITLFFIHRKLFYLKISLILTTFLAIVSIIQQIQILRHREFVVYAIPGALYAEYLESGRSVCITNSGITPIQYNFNVKPNHIHHQIIDGFTANNSKKENSYFTLNQLFIVVANEANFYKKHTRKLNPDYVILRNIGQKVNADFLNNFKDPTFIIGTDFSEYAAEKIEEKIKSEGFDVVNIYKTGAFTFRF